MAIPGHEFLYAHFSNNDRTIVESYWITPDGKETRVENIEAKEGDPNWENLLTHIDIDTLHEATFKHIKDQNKAFEETVMKIAKDQGITTSIEEIPNLELLSWFCKLLFVNEPDAEESKETLFNLKLKLFEMDFVKDCQKRTLKTKLRKAQNLRETFSVALEIFKLNTETTTP
tara:strand:+ start:134 stop:652 length:519 start_codon:yes stop_codon:yes gene_type:complete